MILAVIEVLNELIYFFCGIFIKKLVFFFISLDIFFFLEFIIIYVGIVKLYL